MYEFFLLLLYTQLLNINKIFHEFPLTDLIELTQLIVWKQTFSKFLFFSKENYTTTLNSTHNANQNKKKKNQKQIVIIKPTDTINKNNAVLRHGFGYFEQQELTQRFL